MVNILFCLWRETLHYIRLSKFLPISLNHIASNFAMEIIGELLEESQQGKDISKRESANFKKRYRIIILICLLLILILEMMKNLKQHFNEK